MTTYKRLLLILAVTSVASTLLFIGSTTAQNGRSARSKPAPNKTSAKRKAEQTEEQKKLAATLKALRAPDKIETFSPVWSEAVAFAETPAVRDLKPVRRSKTRRILAEREEAEKNEANTRSIRPGYLENLTAPFEDPTLTKSQTQGSSQSILPSVVTNPINNFDGPDMDIGSALFGGRFAPPDTNAAAGPNHVVVTTNGGIQVFSKFGAPLTAQVRMSSILVGIPNAADDDGDPIVLYDWMADRWMIMQFNTRFTNNQMHMHFAVSKTPDPTGAYYAYDFLTTAGRFSDYPHVGVWPDGYYMSTNDFNVAGTAFLGAGMYALERAKMLAGDPTAKIIGFNTDPTHGGMLPTNHQGYTPPPAGVPNLFFEFDADEFGAAFDLVRTFALVPNYGNPAASTLTPGPDMPTVPFDARNPSGRSDIDQPVTDGLDSIADRFMHALNFRMLPGGVQSYVGNFTVNVSGVNPTSKALFQAGIRWMEFRRNPGTGAITINQQATYAPGAGVPATGRDLWMAGVAQDGEGNIGLAASASSTTLNPTAIYAGRLASDPINTLPQGEVDALAAVTRGAQTGTSNRWGDYSSLFADPADDCTFWGAFEYTDPPTSSFDWNTRIFSFKVNPACVTSQKGTLQFNVTNCETGLPIENASITLNGNPYGATLANGQFSTVINPGSINYSVTKANFDVVSASTTVTNGNTTVVNVCLSGVPLIGPSGATLIQESCPPTNAAADPGETVTVRLNLTNTGLASTSNLVATLLGTANVLAPSGPHSYGAIAPGGTAGRDFTFTANGDCGQAITLTLQLQDGANNLGTANFTMVLGALGAPTTATYSTGNIAVPILDVNTVEVPITVADTGIVNDVNVRVRLNHTFDGDLVISLVHPDGTVVALSTNRGGSGDNFGAGANDCSGTHTVFDQSAATAISAGVAPFAGTFRPEATLNAMNGKASNGTWKLRVQDTAAQDVGTIGCVQLEIQRQPYVCNTACAGAPRIGTTVALSCNGSQVRATYTLSNTGTATANNVTLTTAMIGAVNGNGLPIVLGNLAPGQSAQAVVNFTGAPGGLQNVIGGGSYGGGTFTMNRKMNVSSCAPAAPTIGSVIFRWLPPAVTESTFSLL